MQDTIYTEFFHLQTAGIYVIDYPWEHTKPSLNTIALTDAVQEVQQTTDHHSKLTSYNFPVSITIIPSCIGIYLKIFYSMYYYLNQFHITLRVLLCLCGNILSLSLSMKHIIIFKKKLFYFVWELFVKKYMHIYKKA